MRGEEQRTACPNGVVEVVEVVEVAVVVVVASTGSGGYGADSGSGDHAALAPAAAAGYRHVMEPWS